MNLRRVFNLLLFFSFTVVQGKSQNKSFDRSAFYYTLKSGSAAELDAQIKIVREALIPEKGAYEGTLLMKIAELLDKAKDRLSMFKTGSSKLESAILKNSDNTEYRFLRLIIQEHAPRVVKYRKELEEDSKLIKKNYNSLSPFLQQIIIDYCKSSKVLKIP